MHTSCDERLAQKVSTLVKRVGSAHVGLPSWRSGIEPAPPRIGHCLRLLVTACTHTHTRHPWVDLLENSRGPPTQPPSHPHIPHSSGPSLGSSGYAQLPERAILARGRVGSGAVGRSARARAIMVRIGGILWRSGPDPSLRGNLRADVRATLHSMGPPQANLSEYSDGADLARVGRASRS